ncbi:MAG TPA: hypothetical protein VLC06_26635 [Polyangia bacterium]|nr:hypothetical protein [Polyangia bacterium]
MMSRISLIVCALALTAGTARSEEAPPPPPPDVVAAPPPAAPPMAEPAPPMAPPPAPAWPPSASFKNEPSSGNTIKVGLLLQPQFQSLGNLDLNGNSYNLFLRRTRLIVSGTLFGAFEYFFDTDYPNLFLADNTPANATTMTAASTVKLTPGMNVQDAFVTWKPMGDVFKIDAGYMLPPMAHNAVQGAGTLYSWDYFMFTFLSTANTLFGSQSSPVGRDLGVQLRGLLFDGHLEYRAGLFQGLRDTDTATNVGSNNFFRAVGRIQVNLLDAEPGFFYAGTYLGKKKILSFGISGDTQSSYHYFAGDGFADLPAGPGIFTAQVNAAHWNGGTFIPGLPKETAVMGEIGYNFDPVHISPIFRAEYLWSTVANQSHLGGGLAFWPYGHNSNLKAFYTRNSETGAPHGDNQFNVQWQLYFL